MPRRNSILYICLSLISLIVYFIVLGIDKTGPVEAQTTCQPYPKIDCVSLYSGSDNIDCPLGYLATGTNPWDDANAFPSDLSNNYNNVVAVRGRCIKHASDENGHCSVVCCRTR